MQSIHYSLKGILRPAVLTREQQQIKNTCARDENSHSGPFAWRAAVAMASTILFDLQLSTRGWGCIQQTVLQVTNHHRFCTCTHKKTVIYF